MCLLYRDPLNPSGSNRTKKIVPFRSAFFHNCSAGGGGFGSGIMCERYVVHNDCYRSTFLFGRLLVKNCRSNLKHGVRLANTRVAASRCCTGMAGAAHPCFQFDLPHLRHQQAQRCATSSGRRAASYSTHPFAFSHNIQTNVVCVQSFLTPCCPCNATAFVPCFLEHDPAVSALRLPIK